MSLSVGFEVLSSDQGVLFDLHATALPSKTRKFATAWIAQKPAEGLPLKENFSAPQISPDVLPGVMLWQIQASDYRCRLAGTYVRNSTGVELTGRCVSAFCPPGDVMWSEFAAVAAGKTYAFAERLERWPEMQPIVRTRLLLPLAGKGGDVEFLIAFFGPPFHYDWTRRCGTVRIRSAESKL